MVDFIDNSQLSGHRAVPTRTLRRRTGKAPTPPPVASGETEIRGLVEPERSGPVIEVELRLRWPATTP